MAARMRWLRIGAAGAGLLVMAFLVACGSGDDNDSPDATQSPVTTAVAGEAPNTPSDGPAGGSSGPSGGVGNETPLPGPGLPNFEVPPGTTASANGETVEMGIGTYCWTRMCVDKLGVPTRGVLTVKRGDVVSAAVPEAIPARTNTGILLFEATQPLELSDGSRVWANPGNEELTVPFQATGEGVDVTMDVAPGQYVLVVALNFEGGDVTYGVLLDVQ